MSLEMGHESLGASCKSDERFHFPDNNFLPFVSSLQPLVDLVDHHRFCYL